MEERKVGVIIICLSTPSSPHPSHECSRISKADVSPCNQLYISVLFPPSCRWLLQCRESIGTASLGKMVLRSRLQTNLTTKQISAFRSYTLILPGFVAFVREFRLCRRICLSGQKIEGQPESRVLLDVTDGLFCRGNRGLGG
jgi:hypothetical protein